MKRTAAGTLPAASLRRLRRGLPAVLVTVGTDGWGHAVMTWAAAPAAARIRFGVDAQTRTLANLRRTRRAALQITGPGNLLLLVKGRAHRVRGRIRAAPFAMELWELAVREVKDQTFPGVVVTPLAYRWTGRGAAAMRRMERSVYQELAGARADARRGG